MEGQQKISPRKVARFTIGSLLVIIFMITLVAASRRQGSRFAEGIRVSILNEDEHEFIKSKDIEQILAQSADNYRNVAIARLDLNKLEKAVEANPWVVNAEVYVDNTREIQVQVMQRVPVVRIFSQNGSSWYMDSTLKMLPVSTAYAYPAPVFTNVPVFNNDSFGKSFKAKIAFLSRVIAEDSFWNAQITQVEAQPDQTFVLTPMLGNQKIMFGDTTDAALKLENLFAFYKNVSKKIGWDKYQVLDIRYKGQVIASPAMGYIPPVIKDTIKDADQLLPPAAAAVSSVAAIKPVVNDRPKTPVANKSPQPSRNAGKAIIRQPQKVVNAKPPKKQAVTAAKPVKAPVKQQVKEGKYIYQGKK